MNGNPFTLSEVRHRAEFPQLFLIKKTFYFPVFCLLGVGESSLEALFILCVTGTQRRTWYTERIEKKAWLKRRLLAPLSSSVCHLNLDLEMGKTQKLCGDRSYSKLTRITAYAMVPVLYFRDNFRLSESRAAQIFTESYSSLRTPVVDESREQRETIYFYPLVFLCGPAAPPGTMEKTMFYFIVST